MRCESGEVERIKLEMSLIVNALLTPTAYKCWLKNCAQIKTDLHRDPKISPLKSFSFLDIMPDAQFSLCRASSIPKLEQKYLVLQILFVWNDLTWPEAKSFPSCVLLWSVLTWMLLRILSAWANHWTLFFASHKWNIDPPEITEKEENICIYFKVNLYVG